MKKSLFLVYFCLVLSMIFWGFSFVGTKISLEALTPITLILARLIVSSIFLILLTKIFNILEPIKKPDFKWFILLTIFEPLCYFLGETFGLQFVSSTLGAVLIATIPLFVPWAAWILFREKVSILNLIGIMISIVGVVMIIFERDLSFNASPLGIGLLMIAVFSAVGYTMVIRHISNSYSPITIITWQNLMGIVSFLPLFFIFDFHTFHLSAFTSKIIYTILFLGVFPSSLSYAFFTYAIKELGVNRASIFTNLIPVLTAIFAYFLMDEELPGIKIAGITVVVFALTISQINYKNLFSGNN
ncbi:MAG: DMT family transporter [Bacteroidia bacterium]|nr:DMT family transporter [Bacteroidia bacterium]